MNHPRSFRSRLAVRIAASLGLLLVLGSAAGYWTLRTTLYERLDAVLLRLAAIEAAATADAQGETMHFHDDVFVGAGGSQDSVLVRYAEFWTVGGEPVLHTTNLGARHLPLPAAVRQRVAATERAELFFIPFDGERYRSVLYPLGLVGPQHQAHLLQVAVGTRDTDIALRRVSAFLVALVIVGGAVGGAVGWWIAGYAVRPVLAIIGEAEAMDASRHGHRISVSADSAEMRRLVAVLNALLQRMDGVLEGQRRFLADAGHAIKTPLTVLRGDVDVALRRERTPEEYRHVLAQSSGDLKDVSELAEDLIALARRDGAAVAADREAVEVAPLLHGLQARFTQAASRSAMTLTAEADAGLCVEADERLLQRALSNLVDNAVKYAGAGAAIALEARQASGETIELVVRDSGRGIPAAEQARVFDRFYRGEAGRAAAAGSGLGLAIVRASAEACGGRVELRSEPGRGTTVVLTFPSGRGRR